MTRDKAHPPALASPDAGAIKIRLNKVDPYPLYAELRARGAVHRVEWPGLGQLWMVVRYREAVTVFKDALFVKRPDAVLTPSGLMKTGRTRTRGFELNLFELDPPDHTRLRRLVGKALVGRAIEYREARIEQLADEILARAKARGGIELISEYASVIPAMMISEIVGFPIHDINRFRSFIYALTLHQVKGRMPVGVKEHFDREINTTIRQRRERPETDVISALIQAQEGSHVISDQEILSMVYLLLMAGFVTTVNLIGNGALALLRCPDQMNLLRNNLDLIEGAVEELLRFDSPLEVSSAYFASSDVELADCRVPKGAQIRVLIASANRDETHFPRGETFDITRSPCAHLSFGQGIHFCLGAPLARLEGKVALRMLVERLPGLRLAGSQLRPMPHPVLRGLQQLPLRC